MVFCARLSVVSVPISSTLFGTRDLVWQFCGLSHKKFCHYTIQYACNTRAINQCNDNHLWEENACWQSHRLFELYSDGQLQGDCALRHSHLKNHTPSSICVECSSYLYHTRLSVLDEYQLDSSFALLKNNRVLLAIEHALTAAPSCTYCWRSTLWFLETKFSQCYQVALLKTSPLTTSRYQKEKKNREHYFLNSSCI